MTRMPSLMLTLTVGCLFLSCNDSTETTDDSIELTQCDKVIQWPILLSGPLFDPSWNIATLYLTYHLDSLVNGDTIPNWALTEVNPDGYNDLSVPYYVQGVAQFKCSSKVDLDTCFYDVAYQSISHADTMSWPTYNPSQGGEYAGILACNLDSTDYKEAQFGNDTKLGWGWLESTTMTFRRDAVLLDTNSLPAARSLYKKWWPLPRIPWSKGESVLADSVLWVDSTQTN